MERILTDNEVFQQIKEKSRKAFEKAWKEFLVSIRRTTLMFAALERKLSSIISSISGW